MEEGADNRRAREKYRRGAEFLEMLSALNLCPPFTHSYNFAREAKRAETWRWYRESPRIRLNPRIVLLEVNEKRRGRGGTRLWNWRRRRGIDRGGDKASK